MSNSPIVDIIIPVYNQWPMTLACLNSIFASANEAPHEIIVIDDASTDPEVSEGLGKLAAESRITLVTNKVNRGFTKNVNAGMRMHPERDVLLLNNDTLVFGDWLDRLRRAVYSKPKIATVNPLTNASHIGSYPHHGGIFTQKFEIDDSELDTIAAEVNGRKTVQVHTTVGFCMYICRAALRDLGYFDEQNFPYAYGEESDFCYRSRRMGWKHLIAGDVFVRHFEGQTFGESKRRRVEEMISTFVRLHPDCARLDADFARDDPNRMLRTNLDLARLKLLIGGRGETEISCYVGDAPEGPLSDPIMHLSDDYRSARLLFSETFPNLPQFRLPDDIAWFNTALRRAGITSLRFATQSQADGFAQAMRGRTPYDLGPEAHLCADAA